MAKMTATVDGAAVFVRGLTPRDMMKRSTGIQQDKLFAGASAAFRARNPGLSGGLTAARPAAEAIVTAKTSRPLVGVCPHTGRAYRSRTEARWAAAHPNHLYEPVTLHTNNLRYTPDFVDAPGKWLVEVKGAYIRDRAMHKPKAMVALARACGWAGIKLAQWDGRQWTETSL